MQDWQSRPINTIDPKERGERRHIPEKAEIDNGKLTKGKSLWFRENITLSSLRTTGFETPGSHTVWPPGVWCGRHRDRKQTWTISQEEGGVRGQWPLSSSAACAWRGVCIGKAAAPLFSSHTEHSNKARLHIPLLTPSTPGNRPDSPYAWTFVHVCDYWSQFQR